MSGERLAGRVAIVTGAPAFKQGGWALEDLEESLDFALGADLSGGWNVLPAALPTT